MVKSETRKHEREREGKGKAKQKTERKELRARETAVKWERYRTNGARKERGWQGCARGSAVSCWHYSWFPWWRRYLGCPFPPATALPLSPGFSSAVSCVLPFLCAGPTPSYLAARADTEKEQPPGLSGRDRSFRAPYLPISFHLRIQHTPIPTYRETRTRINSCFSRPRRTEKPFAPAIISR